jgi:hypothetical protein
MDTGAEERLSDLHSAESYAPAKSAMAMVTDANRIEASIQAALRGRV